MLTAALAVLSLAFTPVPVKLTRQGDTWQLLRDGKPYVIRGAGGGQDYLKLKNAGGNSMRTWGADNLIQQLDSAHSLGLTMTVGIWLGHKRHGFKYDDPQMLAEQKDRTLRAVREYKNHPAVLMWALGNEMELDGDEDAIWKHIEELAQSVKKEDPNHPVMTVVAEINPDKIRRIRTLAPSIDVLGVNSYAGLKSLGDRLKQFGWTKPYVVTEHGFFGQWEAPKTSWGIPLEPTSTEKAKLYLENWKGGIQAHPKQCLGHYVFLWGEKQEQTATWHGMYLRTGEALAQVDAMTEAWTGKKPAHLAPEIRSMTLSGNLAEVKPGQVLQAAADLGTATPSALTISWLIQPEQDQLLRGGDSEKRLTEIRDAIQGAGSKVQVVAPSNPGTYRLYLYVYDGKGKAATGNIPFRVNP